MSITEPRRLVFDFSTPYFDSGVVMAIRAGNTAIRSYADLRGLTVAVKTGTEGSRFAEGLQAQYGFELVYFDESPFMYEAVMAGHAVACFEDYPVVSYGINQGLGLQIVTPMERGSSYGFAVRLGQNQELLAMFNQGLANIRASGVYQQILDRYLSTE
jgi:polar amino acid transport system substrate-binding protein